MWIGDDVWSVGGQEEICRLTVAPLTFLFEMLCESGFDATRPTVPVENSGIGVEACALPQNASPKKWAFWLASGRRAWTDLAGWLMRALLAVVWNLLPKTGVEAECHFTWLVRNKSVV
jgi:hypothetical protein